MRDWIVDGRVVLLGAIRQEILSGIRHPEQYVRLRDYLKAFPNVELATADYEMVPEFYNTCRQKGIQAEQTHRFKKIKLWQDSHYPWLLDISSVGYFSSEMSLSATLWRRVTTQQFLFCSNS